MGNVQFGGPAEKQSTLGRHVHKILAVRGNYLLPIFFGFGSWAKAKAVHDGKNAVKLSGGEYLPEMQVKLSGSADALSNQTSNVDFISIWWTGGDTRLGIMCCGASSHPLYAWPF